MKKIIVKEYVYVLNIYDLEVEVDDETYKKLETGEIEIDDVDLKDTEYISSDVIYEETRHDGYCYEGLSINDESEEI